MTQPVEFPEFSHTASQEEQASVLLAYAVRAPSTHNSQPWLFEIHNNAIRIFRDESRQLPEGDKDGRDMLISIGVLLGHLEIVAKYFGVFDRTVIGDLLRADEPIATVFLKKGGSPDPLVRPLFESIKTRFNARGPFLPRPIPEGYMNRAAEEATTLGVSGFTLWHDEDRDFFAQLTGKGMRKVHAKSAFRKELAHWMRSNMSTKKDGIPGYSMLAPNLLSLVLPFLIGTFNCGKKLAELNAKSISSAPAIVVLATATDDSRAWLSTGRRFAELTLRGTAEGIRSSVFVASIEVPELRTELRKHLRTQLYPQFAFAIGYPKFRLPLTPRIAPKDRMRSK